MLVNITVVVLFSPISTTAVFVVRFDDCSDGWLVWVTTPPARTSTLGGSVVIPVRTVPVTCSLDDRLRRVEREVPRHRVTAAERNQHRRATDRERELGPSRDRRPGRLAALVLADLQAPGRAGILL